MNDVEWRRSVEQRFREMNQKLKPSRRGAVGGGGSSYATGWEPQVYATEDDLPTGDREANDMAVLTDGDLAGSWWVPSPGLTGWRPLNVWRAP